MGWKLERDVVHSLRNYSVYVMRNKLRGKLGAYSVLCIQRWWTSGYGLCHPHPPQTFELGNSRAMSRTLPFCFVLVLCFEIFSCYVAQTSPELSQSSYISLPAFFAF